jgi:hypothetical protein
VFLILVIGFTRSHLKKRILVQVRGGAEFSSYAGKRGTNPAQGGRPKGFFEIASN